ncbi:hypothetical protein N657DRAFT_638626 [Parathielavia appendiculata]|uniref:Mediator of RNA polymerase II transcription subunit 16 n=1 Tax=Parathielavia appendiculata TaxID=2587402 RepID=A0AAN6U839_9PEZI|nr:hypothetical protein N657DRAFT_638626 [Parathielavia appendiculata]
MSAQDMSLLMEDHAMSVDGDIGNLDVMQGLDGMEVMGAMDGMESMGSAMALDDVDLFGDPVMDDPLGGPLGAPSPRSFPSKHLQQRLDDLRTRGCCQTIAWSRQGTIASVAKDAMSIDLRFIRCNPDTTEWELSEPASWSPSSSAAPFVHLAWSPSVSPELAVLDAHGRITVLGFSIANNQPYPARRWESDVVDDLHAIVGCYWLPLGMAQNKPFYVSHGPAIINQSEHRYEHQFHQAFGPWHPNPAKSALLCVTTSGSLKLLFTANSQRPEETAIELESVTSSDELITHASLCSDKNTLLIALATASKQLRIVRVQIQWGVPQVDKQVPPGSVPLRPSLKESHVAVTSWFQHGPGESALDVPMAQLSHIEMLPSVPAMQAQPMSHALVLTVRSYIPQDGSPYHQNGQSIIDRWEVVNDQPQALHPAFEQLGSKNGAASAPPTTARLRRLDPIILPKIVVTITTTQFGRVLCFAFSDSTIQYRDRFTMNELYTEQNTNSIMHPLQAGFRFDSGVPCLQVAFSPTNCSFVQICDDSTVKWVRLQYPMHDPNAELQPADQKSVLLALTVASSAIAVNQAACDDVLAIARPFAQRPEFANAWVREMVNMLKITVDYSEETHHDQLVRNTLLQHCFSVINHLGYRGDFRAPSPSGKFAMLALGLRNIFVVITVASNTAIGFKEKLNPLDDPDVVHAVAGCTQWGLSLFAWLMDALLDLVSDKEVKSILSDPKRFPELVKYLPPNQYIPLQMILCSSTRGLLLAACRRLMHVETVSSRATQYYENRIQQQQQTQDLSAAAALRPHPQLYQAYQRLSLSVSDPLVKVSDFEHLLSELASDIHAAYKTTLSGLGAVKMKAAAAASSQQQQHAGNNLTEQQQQQQISEQLIKKAQAHCELDLLLGGNPPPMFREVLLKLVTATLPAFLRDHNNTKTDRAALYLARHPLLGVHDDARFLAMRKSAGAYVDVFKRCELVVGETPRARSMQGGAGAAAATANNNNSNSHSRSMTTTVPAKRKAANANNGEEAVAAKAGGATAPAGGINNENDINEGNGMAHWRMSMQGSWTGIGGAGGDNNNNSGCPQWRRCVRCAAVMEDIWSAKPGYHFLLTQQRKCPCGGSWATVPRRRV